MISLHDGLVWGIAVIAFGGVILRPWRLPEAIWPVLGALALVALGLTPWPDALRAVGKGTDVYLFLIGMMLLSELARREGLFSYVAALAARQAKGLARRLFALVYVVGIVVTVLLSNDATAVVLTPAVYAAARAAKADPLPHLFACAFIANAASFVLPISNPANLVVFGNQLPPLHGWIERFALPSASSIGATFLALRWSLRSALHDSIGTEVELPPLSASGKLAAGGIGFTSLVLLAASAFDRQLGLPTLLSAMAVVLSVLFLKQERVWAVWRGVSWMVLPLVGGLFVLVDGLDRTGVIGQVSHVLRQGAEVSVISTAWAAGIIVALISNLVNNLPAGLSAGAAIAAAHASTPVASAILIGVDLGPNLSVTGSLATILWLVALRREEQHVDGWSFLKLGMVVTPPALLLALASLFVTG